MHTGHSRHSSLASDKISSLERNFRHRKAWTLPKNVKFTVPVNDDSMGKRSSYGTLKASHTSVQARPLASRCSPKRVFNMLVILQNVRNVLSETGLHILCRVKLDLDPALQQDCSDSNITAIARHLASELWTNRCCKAMSLKTNYARADIKRGKKTVKWTIKAPRAGKKEHGWAGSASQLRCRNAGELCCKVIK